jgi:hypothetical protein
LNYLDPVLDFVPIRAIEDQIDQLLIDFFRSLLLFPHSGTSTWVCLSGLAAGTRLHGGMENV